MKELCKDAKCLSVALGVCKFIAEVATSVLSDCVCW